MKTDQNQVWGSHLHSSPAEENVLFCAGRDVQPLPMADMALLPYNLWTNRAHAIMWYEEGVLLHSGQLRHLLPARLREPPEGGAARCNSGYNNDEFKL